MKNKTVKLVAGKTKGKVINPETGITYKVVVVDEDGKELEKDYELKASRVGDDLVVEVDNSTVVFEDYYIKDVGEVLLPSETGMFSITPDTLLVDGIAYEYAAASGFGLASLLPLGAMGGGGGSSSRGSGADGFDENGFDENGYDNNGFNDQGYDNNGFNNQGYDENGYDNNGLDENGYDNNGFNDQGYDENGLDENGYDNNGFNDQGYDNNGFNNQGYDENGYDNNGLDENGYDNNGLDENGYDNNGLDENGYDNNGFNDQGYDNNGFNNLGFDENGYDSNGLDENGYDNQGYDENGYDNQGYDENGLDEIDPDDEPNYSYPHNNLTQGDDIFENEAANNNHQVLHGLGGDDIISTKGTDVGKVIGGSGNDTITGRDDKKDVLHGNSGNDTIYSKSGNDELWGGDGDDFLNGDAGNDFLYGDAGNDFLYGGLGNDFLTGGLGSDILEGGAGYDMLIGGSQSQEGSNTSANTFRYSTAFFGVDIISDFSIVNGDKLDFNGLGLGIDNFEVRYSVDMLWGVLSDYFEIKVDSNNDGYFDSTIKLAYVHGSWTGSQDMFNNMMADGNIIGVGDTADETMDFPVDPSSEQETGEVVPDYIDDGTFNYMNEATDMPIGAKIDGTDNADFIDLRGTNITIAYGKAGDDVLVGGSNDDALDGRAGNDTIHGQAGDDTINGSTGNDYLWGGAGEDGLEGGSGDDFIYGGANDDYITGEFGDDTLTGGAGDDILYGNTGDYTDDGSDTFRYDVALFGDDIIGDFNSSEGDVIDFSGLNLEEADFEFSSGKGELTANSLVDYLKIRVDTTGNGSYDSTISVINEGVSFWYGVGIDDMIASGSIIL